MKTNKNNLKGINFQNDFYKVIELSKQDSFINSIKDLIINSYGSIIDVQKSMFIDFFGLHIIDYSC